MNSRDRGKLDKSVSAHRKKNDWHINCCRSLFQHKFLVLTHYYIQGVTQTQHLLHYKVQFTEWRAKNEDFFSYFKNSSLKVVFEIGKYLAPKIYYRKFSALFRSMLIFTSKVDDILRSKWTIPSEYIESVYKPMYFIQTFTRFCTGFWSIIIISRVFHFWADSSYSMVFVEMNQ